MPGVLSADQSALRFSGVPRDRALDVVFDDHRVWSVDPRELPSTDGASTVEWPAPLVPRLDGRARVELRDHRTGAVLAASECSFGSGLGRVDLTDEHGRRLSLSKWGRLNQSFANVDAATIGWYLDRTEEVLRVLSDELGVPAFLSYGSLLGAVRTGRLIGHDMDIDLGYLSGHETPVDTMRESFEIERHFRRLGWVVQRQNGGFLQVFFTQDDGGVRNLDVFTLFAQGDRLYMINDTACEGRLDDVLPLRNVEIEGRAMPAPRNSEMFLAAAYGPSWRVPDPNFAYKGTPGRRQMRDWFGGFREDRDRWAKHYRQGQPDVPIGPSPFAEWARGMLNEIEVDFVVDAGCGLGGDTKYYADTIPVVLGVDAAPPAIRRARRAAAGNVTSVEFRVTNLGVLHETLALGGRVVAEHPGRRAVVARSLLDAMEPTSRENLIRLCAMVAAGGGLALLEFGTDPEPRQFAAFPGMPRAAVSAADVEELARARGGRVVHQAMVTGPEGAACRMVLQW